MSGKIKLVIILLILLLLGAGSFIFIQNKQLEEKDLTVSTLKKEHPTPTKQTTPEQPASTTQPKEKTPATPPKSPIAPPAAGEYDTTLADLGTQPDWQMLELWQDTIIHDDFVRLLTQVYTVDDSWKRYITIHSDHAIIRTDSHKADAYFKLNFAPLFNDSSPERNWKSVVDLPPTSPGKPLADIRIAIDPGHIGGEFAKLEHRWFQIGDKPPVMEGELALTTARIIKHKLVKLGAKAFLTRGSNTPVNPHRPEFYRELATAKAKSLGQSDDATIQRYQNSLFYLTGEIRARARRINLAFRPDLVLCLHYNAESWADPSNPSLTTKNHYHVLVHGALTSTELAHDDERFEMLTKILQHNFDEEQQLGIAVAQSFKKATDLPAYNYAPNSRRARQVKGADGLWARNLLANRIYQCPVLFLEPYVMNNQEVYDRVQLGNYKGTKKINGVEKKSIQREYADAVVAGLKQYYLSRRIIYHPEEK